MFAANGSKCLSNEYARGHGARTSDYESEGRAFESLRVRQSSKKQASRKGGLFICLGAFNNLILLHYILAPRVLCRLQTSLVGSVGVGLESPKSRDFPLYSGLYSGPKRTYLSVDNFRSGVMQAQCCLGIHGADHVEGASVRVVTAGESKNRLWCGHGGDSISRGA